ncbi:tRNA methyltransferase 10 homolog A-like [Homarus americanus]|uniref:tRNA (guanine(9)-N(1))-methyltransferase n=1 Tax=Homarus americanus TaxID=6706 RepID=A0A8J5JK63_HOMAM|nr:tRNA methyltransferase 10 homolog A-like [Homarus americanus]KAG7157556.1 tRNA methyltransferase 10 A-like [Homarus americanus]
MESDETNSSEGVKQEGEVEMVEGSNEGKGEVTDPGNSVDGEDSQPLSKRQRKKFLRRQKWLDTKQERKKREKEKLRHRLEAKRAAGEPCGNIRKRLKEVTMAASSCKQRIAIDMSFDDLMIEKHLSQCVKQISRCYSANRRVTDPMQLYVTSFEGKCEAVMAKQDGYQNWDVYFKPEYYMDIFPKEEVVYLTSESENVITSLDDTKVYVIGGLVDHNVHKGLCYKLAIEKGIKHAKLPLDDFIEMKTRKVLTVDHVYQILLGVVKGKSWKESLLSIIPARKGATGKDDDENYINDEECDEGNDAKAEKNLENETTKSVEVLGKNNENS